MVMGGTASSSLLYLCITGHHGHYHSVVVAELVRDLQHMRHYGVYRHNNNTIIDPLQY